MSVTSSGKIVLASSDEGEAFVTAQLSNTGQPVTTYGTNGVVRLSGEALGVGPSGSGYHDSVILDSAGRVVVAGWSQYPPAWDYVPFLYRLAIPTPTNPTTPTTPATAVNDSALASQVSTVGRVRARKFRVLTGTAQGSNLTKVQVAVRKRNRHLLKPFNARAKRHLCVWIADLNGSRVRTPADKIGPKRWACTTPPVWLDATGASAWNLTFTAKLPRDRYVAFTRAASPTTTQPIVTKQGFRLR